jgi:hypothetical protein
MGRNLARLTTEEVRNEMSVAGSPDKITTLMGELNRLVWEKVDKTNVAELINVLFALDRVKAEVNLVKKKEERRQRIKI